MGEVINARYMCFYAFYSDYSNLFGFLPRNYCQLGLHLIGWAGRMSVRLVGGGPERLLQMTRPLVAIISEQNTAFKFWMRVQK